MITRANEGHGEYRAAREAGHGVHMGREGGKPDPDGIDGKVLARGAGSVRG